MNETYKTSEHTKETIVQNYVEQIRKHSNFNAFIHINDVQAIAMAKESDKRIKEGSTLSAIDGTVIAIKDNIHVAGMPNTAGTPALKDFIPKLNAPIVDRLLSAGAICIGKTNMHEMAFGVTGYNYAYFNGQVGTRNAFDSTKIAGGSSSGSAVAVAMGMCDVSLGTDTGGSVRIPAALNGLVGFRPTSKRYSNECITPMSYTRDTAGVLAKTVHAVQCLDSIIVNNSTTIEVSSETIRLGYDESQCLANCSEEMINCWKKLFQKLKNDKRVTLIEVNMKPVYELNMQVNTAILVHEANHNLVDYLQKHETGLTIEELVSQIASPDVKEIYETLIIGANAKSAYDNAMIKLRPQMIDVYDSIFIGNKLDAVLAPTTPIAAVVATPDSVYPDAVHTSTADELFAKCLIAIYIQNTSLSTCTGSPSISIPILPNDGLPLGLMLDGRPDYDEHLLSVAKFVETLMDNGE